MTPEQRPSLFMAILNTVEHKSNLFEAILNYQELEPVYSQGRADERKAIVAWMRSMAFGQGATPGWLANEIARGTHVARKPVQR
jgi:hypothetical protein